MDTRQDLWLRHVAGFRSSSGTLKAYCERHGINPKTFRVWRQRLGDMHPRPDPAAEETVEGRAKEIFSLSSGGSPQLLHADLLTNMRIRRSWTRDQKHQIVLDAVRSGMSIDRFARVSGLTPSVVHRWRQEMLVDVQGSVRPRGGNSGACEGVAGWSPDLLAKVELRDFNLTGEPDDRRDLTLG